MGEPRPPALHELLTEDDIDTLVADGLLEIEDEADTQAPLLRLTRRIAEQYLQRFSDLTQGTEAPDPAVALQAAADVDRLAAVSGDAALQEVLANLPEPAAPRTWRQALRKWVHRFAAIVGSRRTR